MADHQDPREPEMRDEEDDAALFARLLEQGTEPEVGEKVSGTLVGFGEDVGFVDLGTKAEAVVALGELTDENGAFSAELGDPIVAFVSGYDDAGSLVLRVKPGRGEASLAELRLAHRERLSVEGLVREVNKGGVEVEVAGSRAFCPISQLDRGYVEDASVFLGQRLQFRITRFEEAGRRANIVLSRRALLEEEAQRRADAVREKLRVGATLHGTVTSIAKYGAFVDLGGLEGLLHVSEMAHRRIDDPRDVVREGQEIEVQVTRIEPAKKAGQGERISLSLRALQRDPWDDVILRFPKGSRLSGMVKGLETYGAFIEIAPGVNGLAHISRLGGGERLRHAREVLELGQTLEVEVLDVDPEKRRVALMPVARKRAAEEERREVDDYLAGQGTDAESGGFGGGSFGSLGDFFKKSEE